MKIHDNRHKIYNLVLPVIMLSAGVLFLQDVFIYKILDLYEFYFHKKLNFLFRQAGFFYCGQILTIAGTLHFIKEIVYIDSSLKKIENYFLFSFLIILIFFFSRISLDALNVPIWDDYKTILGFANKFNNENNLINKFNLIVEPFYESRMIMLRTLVAIQMCLTNQVNFKTIILITGVVYFFIFIFLYKTTMLKEEKKIIFFSLALFHFQFQSYDCLLWATAGFNFVFTIFCALFSFYFLTKNTNKGTLLSLIFGFLAALTYGNGWLVLGILVFFLAYKKRFLQASIALIFCIIIGAFYFNNPSLSFNHIHAKAGFMEYLFYYLAFCGSAFRFFNHSFLCIVSGLVINIFITYLLLRKYYLINMSLFLCLLFLLVSSAITAYFRTPDGGLSQALSPRYGMYSQMLLLCSAIAWLQLFALKYNQGHFKFLLALTFCWQLLSGFMFYPEAILRKKILAQYINSIVYQEEISKRLSADIQNPWLFGNDPELEIKKAMKSGIYKP